MQIQTSPIEEEKPAQKVPDYLVYEIAKGGIPIYYKGYKDVLNGTKTVEEIRMESQMQAWLKAHLGAILIHVLSPDEWEVTAGELGLKIPDGLKRGADIAIFKSKDFVFNEHFSSNPPDVIIEIDIKADTEGSTELDYVLEKIQTYLDFGVQKVIWIFTRTRKVMVATKQSPWLTQNWEETVEVLENVSLNVAELTAKFKQR